MTNVMNNSLNLFWAIVWAVVLILAICGMFWKWAIYVVALVAAIFVGVFVKEYIRIARMK